MEFGQSDDSLSIPAVLSRLASRFSSNLSATFASSSFTDYIRLTAILGGYLLLRPYLQKLGARYQERDHARAVDADEQDSMAATGVKARVIGGQDVHEDDSDDSDGEGWGRRKRIQQRNERARRRRELEENDGVDDEEDKDIQEFLHD